MPASDAATPVVSAFYDRFPYPGDPLQDGPPPGYNWRWCVDSAWAAALGVLPPRPASGPRTWRILDAGCGTGNVVAALRERYPRAVLSRYAGFAIALAGFVVMISPLIQGWIVYPGNIFPRAGSMDPIPSPYPGILGKLHSAFGPQFFKCFGWFFCFNKGG